MYPWGRAAGVGLWSFFPYLDLLQKEVALHKAVAEEATGGARVLQEAGGVGPGPGVSPHQLTVVGNQRLGDLHS